MRLIYTYWLSPVAALGFLAPGGIDHFGAPPLSLPFPLEIAAIKYAPLNLARGLGKRCKLPSGVWDEAPAANDFGEFWGPRNAIKGI